MKQKKLTDGGEPMKCKGVIFDFNGTLFLDNDKHIGAWGEISKELRGKGISDEELAYHINGVPNEKVIEYLSGKPSDQHWVESYSQKKETIYRRLCKEDQENFHLIDGAVTFFEQLREQKIPFTIASASIWNNINFFVKEFQLDRWIDIKNIVYDDGSYESKRQMFLDAAEKIQVSIEEILVFEDAVSGIRSAYEAGCRMIIVVCEESKKEEYEKLPGVIKTISNFQEIFNMSTMLQK